MIAHLFLLLGSLAFLIASIGLFRLRDPYARLHAGTKASSFATLLMVIAVLIRFRDPGSILIGLGILLLVFITAPIACHSIARRLHRSPDP